MEKRLLINYSDLKVKLYDENVKKYEIDLNYESSNYSSCIIVVNSIEDIKKDETVSKLNKNIKKLTLIILSNNPLHLEKYSEKSKFESIISGIDKSNLNIRLNEILKLV